MAYTLLQLVDQVSGSMGLAQPTVVIGASPNQTVQFLALSQELVKDLVREFEWQRLVRAYIFQTTAAVTATGNCTINTAVISSIADTSTLAVADVVTGTGVPPYAQILAIDSATQITLDQSLTSTATGRTFTFAKQDYAAPAGYDRMISDTNWDRTDHWRNLGTKTSQEWQWLQGGVISTGPRERYRIYNNKLRVFPALTTVYTFSFEYVSNFSVIPTGGTEGTKAAFTADTDTCVFPDDLMAAGLKYYFLRAKKLDFGIEMATFERIKSTRQAQDVPVPSMSLSPVPAEALVGPWSIQDGSWPQS